MLDAQCLPYVAYRLVRRIDEQGVIVTADSMIEGCKLGFVEYWDILVAYIGLLRQTKSQSRKAEVELGFR